MDLFSRWLIGLRLDLLGVVISSPQLDLLLVPVHQRYSACVGFPPLSCRPEASSGRSCPQPPESHRVLQGEVSGVHDVEEHGLEPLSYVQRGLCQCELGGAGLAGLCGGCLPLQLWGPQVSLFGPEQR